MSFDSKEFSKQFFNSKPNARSLMNLFESLPNVYSYAKNEESRFVYVNVRMLDMYNTDDPYDLVGKTDRDFHPPTLAEAYIAEDNRVMNTGKPILNQTWLVPHIHGMPKWYVSSKVPLWDISGKATGIAGAMYPIATPEEETIRFKELAPAILYMESNYRQPVSMEAMAGISKISATQFNKRFRHLLRMTPSSYLLTLRIQEAKNLLVISNLPMTEIAISTGFYDQSHFSKKFSQVTGLTPLSYRKRYRAYGTPTK
jgi:AraC-like DNA-binding protein